MLLLTLGQEDTVQASTDYSFEFQIVNTFSAQSAPLIHIIGCDIIGSSAMTSPSNPLGPPILNSVAGDQVHLSVSIL